MSVLDDVVTPCCVLGLDLGKLSDFTALALLEWRWPTRPSPFWRADYTVSTLQRWQLGTPYIDIVQQVMGFIATLPQRAEPLLVIDSTGVGEAVTEDVVRQLRNAKTVRGGYIAVTITAGNAITPRGNSRWHVSKKQLVSHLQVVMGSRRLHVAPDQPQARTLLRELETFSVKITDAGNESFEAWREKDKDDLVLATALAVWGAEYGLLYEFLTRETPPPRRHVAA